MNATFEARIYVNGWAVYLNSQYITGGQMLIRAGMSRSEVITLKQELNRAYFAQGSIPFEGSIPLEENKIELDSKVKGIVHGSGAAGYEYKGLIYVIVNIGALGDYIMMHRSENLWMESVYRKEIIVQNGRTLSAKELKQKIETK